MQAKKKKILDKLVSEKILAKIGQEKLPVEISQKASPDEANRIFRNQHYPKIIRELNRKTIANIGRKLDPTDIYGQTSPKILVQEWLFFSRNWAMFLFFTNAGQ